MARLVISIPETERCARLRVDLACRCYTEALHGLVSLRRDLANRHHRSALRCIRPILEASLRSLYAIYVSSDKQIKRESFPSRLIALARPIEKKLPGIAPMFSHQLLKRKDNNGHSVDRLANGWAHTDVSLIRPYSKPGALEQCCALWTAENFLAFAQAACFSLDPELTPASPYSVKYY
jgi:hypothetical protein